jgi:hypothetical protein
MFGYVIRTVARGEVASTATGFLSESAARTAGEARLRSWPDRAQGGAEVVTYEEPIFPEDEAE